MEIRQDDPTCAAVAPLLAHHLAELHATMTPEFAFALDATGLAHPDVTFWTVREGEAVIGFGALKHLSATLGEVKSMRTAPDHLRKGVSRTVLGEIVATARARGYARLNLETGTAALHDPAVALYRTFGFVDCPPFADYRPSPHNRFMTLAL